MRDNRREEDNSRSSSRDVFDAHVIEKNRSPVCRDSSLTRHTSARNAMTRLEGDVRWTT